MKEKAVIHFLDYEIVNTWNSDGWVLTKNGGELFEYHLGNFNTLENAQKSAVYQFMIARPEHFSAQINARMNGSRIYHDGFKFRSVVDKAGIDMPEEIGVSEDMNCTLTFLGEKI